jgi:cation diffusion facilitator CzcD-associated flavoprotein CzcO
VADNVTFYADELAAVNANGIELKNGKQIDLDIITYATGFNTAGIPSFEVTGKNGLTLRKRFSPYMQSYLSVAVDDFPNYFMMLGGLSNSDVAP